MKFKKKLPESIESKFSNLARQMNIKKRKIYSLGLGEPFYDTPKSISNAAYESIKNGNTRYSDSKGLSVLRKHLSYKYNNKYNLNSNSTDFLITTGSKMGFYIALKSILNPNDNIININPCYPSYEPQIMLAQPNSNIIKINLNKDFSLNLENLKKSFKKKIKVIVINTPNNPTGKIYLKEELIYILKLLKKNKTWLILDMIYEDLNYLDKKVIQFDEIFNYDKTIIVSGLSKSYAMTGWRVGYIFTKNNLINYMNKINQHLVTNVPVFIQHASLEALKNQNKSVIRFKEELKKNYEYFKIKFKSIKIKLPSKIGGMFLFIDVSNYGLKSDMFCEQLLKNYKVATTPGIFFGKKWDSYIRVSLSCNNTEFKKATDKLFKYINSIKRN